MDSVTTDTVEARVWAVAMVIMGTGMDILTLESEGMVIMDTVMEEDMVAVDSVDMVELNVCDPVSAEAGADVTMSVELTANLSPATRLPLTIQSDILWCSY